MAPITPYAALHADPKGEGDARPTAIQIVQDQGLTGKLAGKKVIVTGCSPEGMGEEIARAFHTTGADVYITVRGQAKGDAVAADILKDGGPGKVVVLVMDLASFESVNTAAETYLKHESRLDYLINNAGVMACPQAYSKDGHESQFAANHLGHFLLFQRLKHLLLSSAEPGRASRVVAVSSSGHRGSGIHPEDYDFRQREYDPWMAYGQSKTANIYFANSIDRQYEGKIRAFSLNPGGIWTPLQRHVPELRENFGEIPESKKLMKTTAQGAATSVWGALAKELEGTGGLYLEDCGEGHPFPADAQLWDPGYAPHAFDPAAEDRLWADSLKLVGVKE